MKQILGLLSHFLDQTVEAMSRERLVEALPCLLAGTVKNSSFRKLKQTEEFTGRHRIPYRGQSLQKDWKKEMEAVRTCRQGSHYAVQVPGQMFLADLLSIETM